MSNRAVPGYVLEEMARRSVTNLLIVKPLNAYPGTQYFLPGGRPCTRVPISKNLKDSQVKYDHTTTTESYVHDHQKRTRVHWFSPSDGQILLDMYPGTIFFASGGPKPVPGWPHS